MINVIENELAQSVQRIVKDKFSTEGSGHDWFHIERVLKNALHIAKTEGGDLEIITLGALLHDIADAKFHGGDKTVGPRETRRILLEKGADEKLISEVETIVAEVSYSTGKIPTSLEGKIVQDADRLDAIGAIGIARCFAYGGFKGFLLHDPADPPLENDDEIRKEYHTRKGGSLNHFYEKLFRIKDKLNTKTATKIAQGRDQFMREYVKQFLAEWDGKR